MNIEKAEKLVANLHDTTEYGIHIRNLKQSLNHALVLKKVHRFIKFNRKLWLKPYIKIITELRKKARNYFKKDFFKLMNNPVIGKIMENVRKHRNIKLVTSEKGRNYLVSEPNDHSTKPFTKNLLAIEISKAQIVMKKAVHLNCMFMSRTRYMVNPHSIAALMSRNSLHEAGAKSEV